MIINKSEIGHNSYLFEFEDIKEYSILRRELLVNGQVVYLNNDKNFEDTINIIYSKEYKLSNACEYRVYYHLDDGIELYEVVSFKLDMLMSLPKVTIDRITIGDSIRVYYTTDGLSGYDGDITSEIKINNIDISLLDESLVSSTTVNDLDFIFTFDNGDIYKIEYKLLYKDKKIMTTNSWLLLKSISGNAVRRYGKISYLIDGEVYCSYRRESEKIFNLTNNEEVFRLNDYSIQVMFLLFGESNVNSYKVEFNDLLIN